MSTIVDRRTTNKNKSVGNRQKFIKRYKSRIKRSVDEIASKKGITDVLKDRKITIDQDEIDEPNFEFDMSTGERDIVFTGNKNLQKGDKVYRPPQSEDEPGTQGEDGLDEFSFTLTKEEFLELYFSDMELPSFIKKSLKGETKQKLVRTGYSKEGIPPRLDLVKTLKQAMARRIATRTTCDVCEGFGCCEQSDLVDCVQCNGSGYMPKRYLDDIDLRYKHFTKQPYPIRQATMILIMDTSGSMGKFEKDLAKKFFLLLYLFLHKVYKKVEVIFIAHTTEAEEVTEEEFFYGRKNGGTLVSSALQKAKDIIEDRIDLSTTNVYISQASDGDNWDGDEPDVISLMEDLLTKVQYFAYVQTETIDRQIMKSNHGVRDLIHIYGSLKYKNLSVKQVNNDADVYPVLRSLFEKG
jgi:uncharacterized sporulation protein YeaH/YhbH (DUF444 family)